MGSMSTSNAAPLPRLGEVFFDVRSASRTLRISWYADTGVAVLSIWQGGTCTGSFRLPMGDLPRMIETLQHGPEGWDPPDQGSPLPAAAPGRAGRDPYPDGSGSLHYLNGPPPVDAPDYPENPDAQGYHDDPAPARHRDQPAADRYPDSPTSAMYPDGPVPREYPDQPTQAHHPDSLSPAHYPDQPTQAHYPDSLSPAHHPDSGSAGGSPDQPTQARYPDSPGAAHYPDGLGPAHYLDQQPEPPYSGRLSDPGQAGGIGHADAPSESLTDPYPGGAVAHQDAAGRGSHSPRLSGRADRRPARVPSHRRERPGWADEQPAPGRDSGTAVQSENGLEPLPESFPYGQQRHDHELHERQPEPLRPFT
jgi:hypothetical protein